jgi:hypothetical protein
MEHLIQWAAAEHKGLEVLLFVYSRSTAEYGIKLLYTPCEALNRQIVEIAKYMEQIPSGVHPDPDLFLCDFNDHYVSWKKSFVEFRTGKFEGIVDRLSRERTFR